MLKVSVVMITYGQDKYISDAIRGVLMQQCDFDVELIIANDSSPDNTDSVVDEIIRSHPKSNWIKYTKHKVNKGMQSNFVWATEQCKGDYIALCEGDDYWTDPLKLQKQVEFLELNLNYVMCFHKVDILKPNGDIVSDFITKLPKNFQDREVFLKKGNYIHTPSVIFRNFIVKFPDIYKISPEGDFLLYLLLTKFGKIGYINDVMAIYRSNVGILSKSKDKYFQNILLVNMIALKMVDDKDDINLLIERNLNFALYQYTNLPFSILLKNILNIPNRIFSKYYNKS